MRLDKAGIVLTGAAGGIGKETAWALASRGARLVLVGRQAADVVPLCHQLRAAGREAHAVGFDLGRNDGYAELATQAETALGGVDVLINNAGVSHFGPYATQDADALARLVQTNVTAPMLLTRAILPAMLERRRGLVVNIGSVFGAIGYAHFCAYSASKFALRGFSEALRRELADSGVGVVYVAPRATRTRLNPDKLYRLSEQATGMKFDSPQAVAKIIVGAIERERPETCIGWPERFFLRLNALLPRFVDRGLRSQDRVARKFLQQEAPADAKKPRLGTPA